MSRSKAKPCFVASALTALALVSPAATAAPAAADALVEGADAFVRAPAGDEVPVAGSARVGLGATVRAGRDAYATVTIAPGLRLRLAPGSEATLATLAWLPAEHPGAKPELALHAGAVDVEAPDGALGVTMALRGGATFALWHGAARVTSQDDRSAVALY